MFSGFRPPLMNDRLDISEIFLKGLYYPNQKIVLRPSQPIRVILSVISLPNHTFPGQALSFKWLTSICAHLVTRN